MLYSVFTSWETSPDLLEESHAHLQHSLSTLRNFPLSTWQGPILHLLFIYTRVSFCLCLPLHTKTKWFTANSSVLKWSWHMGGNAVILYVSWKSLSGRRVHATGNLMTQPMTPGQNRTKSFP